MVEEASSSGGSTVQYAIKFFLSTSARRPHLPSNVAAAAWLVMYRRFYKIWIADRNKPEYFRSAMAGIMYLLGLQ